MPKPELVVRFYREVEGHRQRSEALARLAEQLALASIVEVLPTAESIEVFGEFNEDLIPRLRIRRVLDGEGAVLYDAREGQDDRRVEDAVDNVDIEYLDVLIDGSGDEYLGSRMISHSTASRARQQ